MLFQASKRKIKDDCQSEKIPVTLNKQLFRQMVEASLIHSHFPQ